MEMEDQYNLGDLRQLMNGAGRPSHFPAIQSPTELFPTSSHHRPHHLLSHQPHHPYEIMMMSRLPLPASHDMMPRGIHEFRPAETSAGGAGGGACNNNSTVVGASCSLSVGGGVEMEGVGGCLGGDGGSGRWPRQETLTLLEVRSRLDHKFKEANQKGPLWDEVSRIMSDEHGYQRSGKKCREKFENLYKYYKKTKEGKAGRQDGKHYRFFRQLEALYGETSNNIAVSSSLPPDQSHFVGNNNNNNFNNNNNNNSNTFRYQAQPSHHHHQDTTTTNQSTQSLSNSSEFEDSSSSEDNGASGIAPMDDDVLEMKRMRKRRGWKVKIKEFIDAQMRKMMERQDEWLERLMSTVEQKERERVLREEEWRKQEACRAEREQQFWAKERAWIESRDKALMDALQKLTGSSTSTHEVKTCSSTPEQDHDDIVSEQRTLWPECEINRLVQLRGSMESRFSSNNQRGDDQILWEEIASKMSCLGYERSGTVCKEKWESISNYGRKCLFSSKKRKENNNAARLSTSCYFGNNEANSSMYNSQGGVYASCDMNNHEGVDDGSSPRANPNVSNPAVVNETCFPFLMGEGDSLWENYGLKLSKG